MEKVLGIAGLVLTLGACSNNVEVTPHKCDVAQSYQEQRQTVIQYSDGRSEAHLEVYTCVNPSENGLYLVVPSTFKVKGHLPSH